MVEAKRELMLCIALFQALAVYCIQASSETLAENATTTLSLPEETEYEDMFSDKHVSFQECTKFELDPDEFFLFPNETVYVELYKKTYTKEFFHLDGDILLVCDPSENKINDTEQSSSHSTSASDTLSLFANIGLGVSMVCLLIHLVVFALVPDLQNIPGCNLASLCVSLFFSYISMIAGRFQQVYDNDLHCTVIAVMKQFFFLGSFLWMFVISFDVFRAIRKATSNLRVSSNKFNTKKFLCNCLFAWGISLTFAAAATIIDNVNGVHELFKPQFEMFCWFKEKESLLIFFAGPVFILIGLNLILFGVSTYSIFTNRMHSSQDSHQSNLKNSHAMYFRLAIIMGVTWIIGAVAPAVNKLWLWYVFAALNAFQGFFIFVAFTCIDKVKKHFRIKLFGERKISMQNLIPSFQSVSNNVNRIQNVLYKKSKDNSDVGVAVAIHL